MQFDPTAYGPEVAGILALDGDGHRLMPLAFGRCSSEAARERLRKVSPKQLFPVGRDADAAFSGLWLYFSCLEESHSCSQAIATPDGNFWHGIMHRQEPDPGNSAYWFRRVGKHPIFPRLRAELAQMLNEHPEPGFSLPSEWDPFAFIDFCEEARLAPGSPRERLALEIQRAEWQLLFDHCARPS